MGITDIFRASKIKDENTKLKEIFDEIGATEAIEVKERIEQLKKEEQEWKIKINQVIEQIKQAEIELTSKKKENQDESKKLDSELIEKKRKIAFEIKQAESELLEKTKQIVSLDDVLMLESFGLYTPHYAFQNSEEYKIKLDSIRGKQKEMIKAKSAAMGNINWTVNGSKSEGTKMVNDMIKLVLRAFNNECDYCIDNVKFNNIESAEKRMTSSFDALNKLGRAMDVSISYNYRQLKFEELYLAHEYQQKKQEEKEEQKRLKEEMREQMKFEQELKVAREKLQKEKKHYAKAIIDIQGRIEKASTEEERIDLTEKLKELEERSSELDKEEKELDYREKNAKAGYVYVISNIGSFGENVFKIGMTRRLDPEDRVYELGDASVPFPFDIHAMVFSDNAPELERKLQDHFRKGQLNKINNRKEFFKADIHEVEKIIRHNYDKVVDLVKVAPAEQYRESILISNS